MDHIAHWDGTTWDDLGGRLNDKVRAIAVVGSDVYVSGDFTDAGGKLGADYVARWDGAAWQALGSGLNGLVAAVAVAGSDVYVGGFFAKSGSGGPLAHMASWDSEQGSADASRTDTHTITLRQSQLLQDAAYTSSRFRVCEQGRARWDGLEAGGYYLEIDVADRESATLNGNLEVSF